MYSILFSRRPKRVPSCSDGVPVTRRSPRPRRSLLAGVAVVALVASGAVFLAPGAAQATAAYWYTTASVESRHCGATHEYSGISHQICLEYSSGRTMVRAAGFIYAGTTSYFQASVTLTKPGGSFTPVSSRGYGPHTGKGPGV